MSLAPVDLAVLVLYFVTTIAVGLWFGRRERDTHDYFLGGRTQHWLVVGLSIVATEVSALTFIAVPALSFHSDWSYLQMYAGAFVGRMLIILFFLPAFYGGSVTTVYQYLGQRFGPLTRTTASMLFIVSRLVGSGIRLLVASIGIAVVFGWPVHWVILGTATAAVGYTTFGGIKAIIWTDALQALVFVGGGVAVLIFLFVQTPGDWASNLSTVRDTGKLHTFTWGFALNSEKMFWVLLISSTFHNCAALGVDQDLTQRMLTCPDLRRGQRSLMFNAIVGFPIVCLFLMIGTMMSAYYAAEIGPPLSATAGGDSVFAEFIANALPDGVGLKGLLIAGIFAAAMSSLDSALGALSSTAVTDFYVPFRRRFGGVNTPPSQSHLLFVARVTNFGFGVLLAVVALAFIHEEKFVWEVLKWVGLIFGGMLGVFVLGIMTKSRGHDVANVFAMLSSVALLVGFKTYQEHVRHVYIAWPWWVVIGTLWTVTLGACWRTQSSLGTHQPKNSVTPNES